MLAILYRAVEGCPVLVAANREESYARQGTPPELWQTDPPILAGRDPLAGGTWLGVNRFGLLVAITNRRGTPSPPQPRSRGLLCRDLLACGNATDAHAQAFSEIARHPYAGFNLLILDSTSGFILHADTQPRSRPLSAGIFVLTTGELNDNSDARIAHALQWLETRHPQPLQSWLQELPHLCSFHGDANLAAICLHSADRGTVSSSIIALPAHSTPPRWLHVQGPPCHHTYSEYSQSLAKLLTS